jgi:hypothetical protein
MTFEEILDQAIAMLQRRGRVTYRTLQLQFQLDEDQLEALKDELLFAHSQVRDEAERGLVWTGALSAAARTTRQQAEAERQFHTVLLAVMALLQREQRITYRTLRYAFGVDEACLHAVRDELCFRQLAHEEGGQGLVWTGADPPPAVSAPYPAPATAMARSVAPPRPPLPPPEVPQPQPAPTSALDEVSSPSARTYDPSPHISLTPLVAGGRNVGWLVVPARPAPRIPDAPDAVAGCTESDVSGAGRPARGPPTTCPAPVAAAYPAPVRSAASC